MKNKTTFSHPAYRNFSGKYTVHSNGRVFGPKGELKYFSMGSGGRFVRLFNNGGAVSITVGKLVMLSFRPNGYRKDRVVMHIDGNVLNDSLSNLKFGTRSEQSLIHVSNSKNWRRISRMGRKYGPKNGKAIAHLGIMNLMTWREFNGGTSHSAKTADRIRELYMNGMPISKIADKLKISRSSIYNHI
jgi:hypothetical protein